MWNIVVVIDIMPLGSIRNDKNVTVWTKIRLLLIVYPLLTIGIPHEPEE